jgi:hypothetical protein
MRFVKSVTLITVVLGLSLAAYLKFIDWLINGSD